MGQRLTFGGELNRVGKAQGNRVRIGRQVARAEPEAVAIYPWPG